MSDDHSPVLFVQTAFLGDLILSIPTLKKIRQLQPSRPIWLVAKKGVGQFMVDFGFVDRLFEVEKGQFSTYKQVQKEIGGAQLHWLICPHESFTTARFIFPLRARTKVGFEKFWNFLFFDRRVLKDPTQPEVFRQMQLLTVLDENFAKELHSEMEIDWNNPAKNLPEPPQWALCRAEKFVSLTSKDRELGPAENRVVAIFPGSVWATKRWTESGFCELVRNFSEAHFDILVMGSESEKDLCQNIAGAAPGATNLAGELNLTETINQLSQCNLVVSNDSAGAHLAAVAGVPVLTIFGPTVLEQGFRPWAEKASAVWNDKINCRPCGKHGHETCPIGTHDCMKKLSSVTVFSAAMGLVNSPSH